MYKGYIEICPDEKDLTEFYQHPENNIYNCLENQYLIVDDEDGVADRFKWTNGNYKKLSYKQINNSFVNKIHFI